MYLLVRSAACAALASLVLVLGLTEVVTAVDPAVSTLSGLLDGSAVIVGGVLPMPSESAPGSRKLAALYGTCSLGSSVRDGYCPAGRKMSAPI